LCNGITAGHSDLTDLVLRHGGSVEQYPTEFVTHVIAEKLATSKAEAMRNRRNGAPPIVHPDWLRRCAEQGRRLDIADFVLAARERGQPVLGTALFQPRPGPQAPSSEAQRNVEAQRAAAEARRGAELLRGPPQTTSTDPNFVRHYFEASRLHLIGEWRTRVRKIVASLEGQTLGPDPQTASADGDGRVIMHIDMDAYFASVGIRDNPSVKGQPVAIAHAPAGDDVSKSTAEISSCSYEARAMGVRANMRVCEAKKLCPNLVVLPYNMEAYMQTSEVVFRTLRTFTSAVQTMSLDEASIDVTGLTDAYGGPEAMAEAIRVALRTATGGCNASVGIAHNKLLAKMATRRAKPNGQFRVASNAVHEFMDILPVGDLPGVGGNTRHKLHEMAIFTIRELASCPLGRLQGAFGALNGVKLLRAARGEDISPVEAQAGVPKSRGAEVNWGVRLTTREGVVAFVNDLATEVAARLEDGQLRGSKLVVKALKSIDITKEPYKFLGTGECTSHSKSVTLRVATRDAVHIAEEANAALAGMNITPNYLRGVGIHMSLLSEDPVADDKAGGPRFMLQPAITAFASRGVTDEAPPELLFVAEAATSDGNGAAAKGPAPPSAAVKVKDCLNRHIPQKSMDTIDQELWTLMSEDEKTRYKKYWANKALNAKAKKVEAAAAAAGKAKPQQRKSAASKSKAGAPAGRGSSRKRKDKPAPKQAAAKRQHVGAHEAAQAVVAGEDASKKLLCAPEPLDAVSAALADAVHSACAVTDPHQRDAALAAAGAVLAAYCEMAVKQGFNSQAAFTLLRRAVRLQDTHPAWTGACQAACAAAQAVSPRLLMIDGR